MYLDKFYKNAIFFSRFFPKKFCEKKFQTEEVNSVIVVQQQQQVLDIQPLKQV